jgi:hypothetical protein
MRREVNGKELKSFDVDFDVAFDFDFICGV